MIRRFAVLLSLATVLAIPSLAHATTVTLSDYSGIDSHFTENAPGGGGPFTATTGADGGLLGNNVSFLTFCIEFNEHFSYGDEYNFELSDGAKNGGVDGGNPDAVSDATKWLYYQAVTGGYSSLPFESGIGTDNFVGARVQEAIWFLEQERAVGDISAASKTLADYAFDNQNWSTLEGLGYQVWRDEPDQCRGRSSGSVGDDDPCT